MEYTKNEVALVEKASIDAEAHQVSELNELQLTLVGGGCVTVIIG